MNLPVWCYLVTHNV